LSSEILYREEEKPPSVNVVSKMENGDGRMSYRMSLHCTTVIPGVIKKMLSRRQEEILQRCVVDVSFLNASNGIEEIDFVI